MEAYVDHLIESVPFNCNSDSVDKISVVVINVGIMYMDVKKSAVVSIADVSIGVVLRMMIVRFGKVKLCMITFNAK